MFLSYCSAHLKNEEKRKEEKKKEEIGKDVKEKEGIGKDVKEKESVLVEDKIHCDFSFFFFYVSYLITGSRSVRGIRSNGSSLPPLKKRLACLRLQSIPTAKERKHKSKKQKKREMGFSQSLSVSVSFLNTVSFALRRRPS